jgi:hypothetical protein
VKEENDNHQLLHPEQNQAIVEHNYRLGQEHFSYQTLEHLLRQVLPPFA